jgi:hypothetical protein
MESHQFEGVPEALPIIEAEILTVIPFTLERVAVGREGGDQGVAVLGLVVDNNAVEIEEDRAVHARSLHS